MGIKNERGTFMSDNILKRSKTIAELWKKSYPGDADISFEEFFGGDIKELFFGLVSEYEKMQSVEENLIKANEYIRRLEKLGLSLALDAGWDQESFKSALNIINNDVYGKSVSRSTALLLTNKGSIDVR